MTFTVIFLPIYFFKIKPRQLAKKKKDELKAMEAQKSDYSSVDPKYGSISATPRLIDSSKTTAELLAAGNYSPLGPVVNGRFFKRNFLVDLT